MDFKPFKMGRYLLMERLATGGMAEVYRAKAGGAGGFEKQVAIKRILPTYSQNEEFRKMFEYEARLSSQLTHSNIVQVYDFNKFGETYLLAMEYVDGKNLRQFVNKTRKVDVQFPIEFSVFVMNEVCKGLEYAHTKKDDMTGKSLNIIHRDMSPQNIMLSYEGAVKIVDFGIAKAKDRADETRSGVIKGKFGYMSPEQANGLSVDHRTDIFSTGIILWEMLTGRRLFAAESDMATLRMIQECVIMPPSKINPRVPPELEKIVMKVLSKDLKLRYNSAGDLHRHLLEFLSKNAPAFTQREVSEILQKTFADEIGKEKKRFEQLSRQTIPFSQGVAKEDPPEDSMADVEEMLDGMQTKSDIVEETGDTFSDENKLGDPQIEPDADPTPAPEVSHAGIKGQRTAVSYTIDEDLADQSIVGMSFNPSPDADPEEGMTKSQASVPTEGEESVEPAVDMTEAAPTEASAEEEAPSEEIERTQVGTPSEEINLTHGMDDVDLVLPGGRKHSFNKVAPEGPAKRGLVLEQEENPPSPEQKLSIDDSAAVERSRSGALIVPMGGASADKSTPPEPEATPTPVDASTVGENSFTKAVPRTPIQPAAPRSVRPTRALESPSEPRLEMQRSREPEPEVRQWRTDVFGDAKKAGEAKKRRLMHPMVSLLIVMGLTGYMYKLYLDGAVEAFMEKSRREPTEKIETAPPPMETDPISVDRKPVGDCTLNVRSNPPGAEVFEGSHSRGFTPIILSGPCNRSVNIVLRKEGYEYLSENVVIGPKVAEWSRTLRSIPMGRLALNLGFNAEVYLNGEKARDARSRVPLEIPLRAKRSYELRLVNKLLNVDFKSDVLIEEGQQTAFNLSLDEASARSRAPTSRKKR